ncbi:MAG: response regulator [Nitrospirae bacterium]|nr:response regulator [Nitrospirota bacterium]
MLKNILAVDDSVTMRQTIATTLEKEGYSVTLANDGVDALGKLNGDRYHVIITDINMPNMDGIRLILEVRKLPAHKFTPVIVLTTESQPEKKEQGKSAGATGWIVKPFKPEQLIAVVKKVCP